MMCHVIGRPRVISEWGRNRTKFINAWIFFSDNMQENVIFMRQIQQTARFSAR